MKKPQIIGWGILLLVLSVPAGFLVAITEKPYTSRSEYPLMFVAGTIACIIVLGGLSWGVYAFLKRRSDQPLRRAFQVYTFFALAMIAVGSYKLPKAIEKRDHFEFMVAHEEHLRELVFNHLDSQQATLPGNAAKHMDMISFCMISEIEMDDNLFEALKKSGDYDDFVLNDPRMKKQLKECVEMYKD